MPENIFRIIQWNLLKPKNSKTILIVVDFHKKKNQESSEICGCFKLKLLKSTLFWKSFGRGNLRIGCIKLAQTSCISFSYLLAWLLFDYKQIWRLKSESIKRCKRIIRNVVKDQQKNLRNKKYDAQVKVIGKAVMIAGNIILSIFWTSEFELEGWKFTMTDRSLYLSELMIRVHLFSKDNYSFVEVVLVAALGLKLVLARML